MIIIRIEDANSKTNGNLCTTLGKHKLYHLYTEQVYCALHYIKQWLNIERKKQNKNDLAKADKYIRLN